MLCSHDGQWVPVRELKDTCKYETVHNLRIADYHTYFVGSENWRFSIWAHNTNGTCSTSIPPGAPGSAEHKALRWKAYQDRGGSLGYEQWSNKYNVAIQNSTGPLLREAEYRAALGGDNKVLNTPLGNRQIDVFVAGEKRLVQLKTGREYLTTTGDTPNLDAIKKDAWFVKNGYTVEWVLEQGGSKQLLAALRQAGIKVHLAPLIP